MADIINGMSEDTYTNCVIFLDGDEAEALEDLLVQWFNGLYRKAHLPNATRGDYLNARVLRYTLNDLFQKLVGWDPITDPRTELACKEKP